MSSATSAPAGAGGPDSLSGGGSGARPRGRFDHIFAALDLGTNNCRLLVAKPVRYGFRVVDAFSRIVRLGEGLGASGHLSEAAQGRAIEALQVCADKMQRRAVTRARYVATEACRKAGNCAEFMDKVRAKTGLELEIISAAEEAQLALAGCSPLLDYENHHALVFDIGGGSTELMWLKLARNRDPEMLGWTSIPYGVVTLAERWGAGEMSPEIYTGMVEQIGRLLRPFEDAYRLSERFAGGPVQMLGTSGTVTTIAGVLLNLERYDRSKVDGCWLPFDRVLETSQMLARSTIDERAAHPCIGRERADLVVAGCAILEAIYNAWPTARLRVADRGVREGVLLGLMRAADQRQHGSHR